MLVARFALQELAGVEIQDASTATLPATRYHSGKLR